MLHLSAHQIFAKMNTTYIIITTIYQTFFFVIKNISFKQNPIGGHASFCITSFAKANWRAVHKAIICHHCICYRHIPVCRRIWHTVHNSQWRTKSFAAAFVKQIVHNPLPSVNDAYATCTFFSITQKNIVLYSVVITVPKYYAALTFFKQVITNHIAATFN